MSEPIPLKRGSSLDLSGDFGLAFRLLNTNTKNFFVTGKAGTGKSTLLRYFVDECEKRIALLAPTGIASINIGGETIHSFFGFPPRTITEEHIYISRMKRELYKSLEVIVIDEVSMVRADLMDGIDQMLRLNRDLPRVPFGGVQMLFFGDIFQLEPVVSSGEEAKYFASEYASPFFFDAKVFQENEFEIIDLRKVFRQKDLSFIDLLDSVRLGTSSYAQLERINTRHIPGFAASKGMPHITLTSTNRIADEINNRRLSELPSPEFTYRGQLEGDFPERTLPAPMVLTLKCDSQIMFVKNDSSKRWVNGTMGKICELGDDHVIAAITENGREYQHEVPVMSWDVIKHKLDPASGKITSEIVGSYYQYPLKLAWAVTIHKSQGLTFNHTIIDLGRGAFAHGQTYVALSRCTNFDGLVLRSRLRGSDLIVDQRAKRFYARKKLNLDGNTMAQTSTMERNDVAKEIEKTQTPEEKELREKALELASLETELAQKELDLATLVAELQALESRYVRVVGSKFLELDQLHAEIAELLAQKEPENETVQHEAKEARQRAEETARDTGDVSEPRKIESFKPTREIRDLYRKIAKKIHPDLAVDEKDRDRRTKTMAEVNKAYEEGDVKRLEAILREWETSPEAIEGEDVGSRLVRIIRMIARVRDRIIQIEKEMQVLMESDLYELKLKYEEAKQAGRDLFKEMTEQVELEIQMARHKLNNLKTL